MNSNLFLFFLKKIIDVKMSWKKKGKRIKSFKF